MDKINIDSVECDIIKATMGKDIFDISPLLKKYKKSSFDQGFVNTASCKSSVTYIDGDEGILIHRGYKIEDIVEKKSFMQTMYLILKGEFPSKDEESDFTEKLHNTKIDIDFLMKIAESLPNDSHPMGVLMSLSSSLAAIRANIRKTKDNFEKVLEVIKSMLYMVSIASCKANGREFIPDFIEKDYTQAFANMALSKSIASDKNAVECLDKILSLHIDHGQNASTSTLRMIASTKCDLYGATAGAIAALWGPLHGGANEAVLKMIDEIGSLENVDQFIENVKSKKDGAKLMGFGHRVYKNYDPRAKVLQKYANYIMQELKIDGDKLKIANKLEKTALSDEYFITRKLFPNVDFYSGIVYDALGINTKTFTCMFALSRVVGWCAQWLEVISEDEKIWRPDQVYIGKVERKIA